MSGRRIAVLGAGALGLTVAHRLTQRGDRVTVFEREPLPGGLAAGFEIEPGMWLEKFYHHIFRSDRAVAGLIDELGLGDDLVWPRPRTVTLRDGRVHQLDSPASLLRFDPLPIADRIRMGAALAYLRALPEPARLEGRTAAAWIRRSMGKRAYEVVWAPLLEAKFGAAAEEIALPWFWARVHHRSAELGYLRGGFQRLYQALADRVRDAGGDVRLGVEVREIATADGEMRITTGDATDRFDHVVSTLPTTLTCRLTPQLPDAYRERHDWRRAYGAHCLILSLDRPLTDSYWMNINDPGYPFLALVEHTNYQSPADYGGRHLVYLGNYRPMDDPLLRSTPEEALAEFTPHLRRINPDFDPSWITERWGFAAPFAQPIVTTEYRDRIPPFETPIAGLSLANMFQVYPHDRGQNYSVELAEKLVQHLGR
ncbi:MAG: NAD(P)/FAD-dependent oxidoreductase [Chloroflexi bacterium]|nr:NAD(P)/FAD-dependent oxidoreductase [Chloroflexota bacterium]